MHKIIKTLEFIGQNGSLNQHESTDKLLNSLSIQDCSNLINEVHSNDQFCGLLPADDEDGDEGGASEEE